MMNNRRLKNKDWQIISTYLDGQLTKKQSAAFKVRLVQETALREALRQVEWTKSVLRKAPHRKVPHHFILTRQMAAEAKRYQNRAIRQYGLVSGIASLTFLILAGFQLLPLFRIGMAPNFAMVAKEALIEDSVMMEAETLEEAAAGEPILLLEAVEVEAEPAENLGTVDMMEGVAEEVIEEEMVEIQAFEESEEQNEASDSVEEERQPPMEGSGLTPTPETEPTLSSSETPTAATNSAQLEEEFDATKAEAEPRDEQVVELPKDEAWIEEETSMDNDESLFDQSGTEIGESVTRSPSVLEILAFTGMLVSALVAIIALVAVFRTKNRS